MRCCMIDCARQVIARNLCAMHYQRLLSNGLNLIVHGKTWKYVTGQETA